MTKHVVGRRALGVAALGLAGAALARPAIAQARTLRWVIGYPPGGATDIVARLLANGVSSRLGQTIVVENRPGAATTLAAEAVARAAPDGETVMTVDMGTMVYNRALYRRLPYDPERDLRPVSLYARFAFTFAVAAELPVRTMAEFVALARSRGGALTYASPGVGSPHHLGMERFRRRAGIELTHVPYRGAAPAVQDLSAGTVSAMVLDVASGLAQFSAGRIRPIAAMSSGRIAALPELPTLTEAGVPGADTYSWHGVVAPAALPDEIAARLHAAIAAAVREEAVVQRLAQLGAVPLTDDGPRFRAVIDAEAASMLPVIAELGINLDS
jgi:tripartite-type tricarboxylate transporter receptor subunit TctC